MQSSDFELLDILGEGAAAVTYEARDANNRIVCVKRFKTSLQKKETEEFQREIEMLQTLRHPRIPKLYGSYIQKIDGRDILHLVMEKIEGMNLKEWRKIIRPDRFEVLDILLSLLDILVYLHDARPPIIHRDIKTSNVLRTPEGAIFLIDFGQSIDAIHKTYGHTLVTGTLGYQAPEQIHGSPNMKSDVYSVGVLAVELLTGIPPHEIFYS